MDWCYLGHASWLADVGGTRILCDPQLGDTHHDGIFRVHPHRTLNAEALRPDIIVVTHRHPDHFDVNTLDRLAQLDPTTLRPPTRREPCPWCGVAVGAGMLDCARCQQPLVAGQAFTHDVVTTRSGSVYVAWAVSVFGLVVMSVAVGIALAIEPCQNEPISRRLPFMAR